MKLLLLKCSFMKTVTENLLKWYEKNGRELPWRTKGGAHPSAYAVWVSEIMLQQTTVKTVLPFFDRFMKRFPTVESLANAPLDDVLLMWQGLGYYTRARKLHEAAKAVVEQYGGHFPANRAELAKLPGIGAYTSASVAAFAFNLPESPVDGNVIRVVTRLNGWDEPTVSIMDKINACADELIKAASCPADYASAIMDLGATVCTPKSPQCLLCPLRENCKAFKDGTADKIPVIVKLKRDARKGYVFLIKNAAGEFYIRTRSEKGLLHGLTEFPWNTDETLPFEADWKITRKKVKHVFTHFDLTLTLVLLNADSVPAGWDGRFAVPEKFADYPFSTLMKKVVAKIS